MTEENKLNNFMTEFHAEILDRCGIEREGATTDFKENVFTQQFVEYLVEDIGALEDPEICFYSKATGKGYIKTNGFNYDEGRRVLSLLVSIYRGGSSPSVSPTDIQKVAKQTTRFHRATIDDKGLHVDMEPSSDQFSMVQRIHEVQDGTDTVRIIVFVDGTTKLKEIEEEEINGTRYVYDIWDIQRLFRIFSSKQPYESLDINLGKKYKQTLPCIKAGCDLADYNAYMVIIPAEILYDLYDEYGSRLLELNVRSYIQN